MRRVRLISLAVRWRSGQRHRQPFGFSALQRGYDPPIPTSGKFPMSSGIPEGSRIAGPLEHRVREDAAAPQIADAIVSTWLAIDAVLVPIIGKGGVGALFRRSAHLSISEHPWLAAAQDGMAGAADYNALKALLLLQSPADSLAGGSAMLQTFRGLLAGLVGASLTEQLLRSVWHPIPRTPSDQDIPS